jgi:hypothetical protein
MGNDYFGYRVTVGLRKPETAKEAEARATLNGMRQAIERGSRDSALIRQCLDAARYQGLSGEDTYAQLAYHALMLLEEYAQRNLDFVMRDPRPPLMMLNKSELIG